MNISIHVIVEELRELNPELVCNFDVSFSSYLLLESVPTGSEVLNICDVTKFVTMNNITDKKTFIVVDPLNILDEVNISSKVNLIAIKDNITMTSLVNRIIKIFEKYNGFEQSLLRYVYQGVSLENILIFSYKTIGLEMYLNDSRGNILFRNSNTFKYYPQTTIVSKTIRDGKKALGSLSLMKSKILSEKYQVAMFSQFCSIVEEILELYFNNKRDAYNDLNKMIFEAVSGAANIDRELISRKLSVLGWSIDDKYRLMLIVSHRFESIQLIIDYLNEQYKKDSLLLKYEGKYIFIVNNDKVDGDILLSELRLMLNSKSDLKILASIPFNDLSQVNTYYQFLSGLIGRIDYELIDLSTDTIKVLLLLTKNLDNRVFINSEILRLQEVDQEIGGDLLETLYAYICYERSLIKTAEKLNVHRNTVVYRTNKINEIIHLDLDNPLLRYHVLISILLLVGDKLLKYN